MSLSYPILEVLKVLTQLWRLLETTSIFLSVIIFKANVLFILQMVDKHWVPSHINKRSCVSFMAKTDKDG